MTADIVYTEIKILLEGYGYKEIPDLMNIEEVKESQSNKGFILQPTGSEEIEYTNSSLTTEHEWKLEIVYRSKNLSDRVTNYSYFHSVKQNIQKKTDFKGFLSKPKFERLADLTFHSVGTLEFSYGIEGS